MAKIVLELSPAMNINDHVWDHLHRISKGEIQTDRQIWEIKFVKILILRK